MRRPPCPRAHLAEASLAGDALALYVVDARIRLELDGVATARFRHDSKFGAARREIIPQERLVLRLIRAVALSSGPAR